MVSERARSNKLNQVSPIHPTIEATHDAYNEAVAFILQQQASDPKNENAVKGLSFVVASHNHDSIDYTCELMEKHGIPRSGGWVSFGQLMGMQDTVTHTLASNGYEALKYVPYGPIEVTIPYLHRRAQENQTMLAALAKDKSAIKKEIRIRMGMKQ